MKPARRSLAQNSALTLGANIAGYLLTFGASVLVSRTLLPTGKGLLQQVILIYLLLTTVGALGLAPAFSFLIAKGRHGLPTVGRHAAALAGALGLGLWLAASLVILLLPEATLPGMRRGYALAGAGLVPFALLIRYLGGVLQGAGQLIWWNAVNLTQAGVYAVAAAGLWRLGRLDVTAAVAAFSVSQLAAALVAAGAVWWLNRQAPGPLIPGRRWNPALVREAARYGRGAYGADIVSYLNLRADQYLVSGIAGDAALGLYSIAVTVAELILFFPRALAAALLPRITGASREDAGHIAASACRHTLLASLLGLIGLIPLALLIPFIFGPAFQPAVLPGLLLAPGVAGYSLAPVLSTYFSGQLGRPALASRLAALSLGLDVLLVLLLVPAWGIRGAALASALAYLITAAVMLVTFRRLSGIRWRELLIPQSADWAAYRALLRGIRR